MNRFVACIVVALAAIGIVITWVSAIGIASACGPGAGGCVALTLVGAGIITVGLIAVFIAFLNPCLYGHR